MSVRCGFCSLVLWGLALAGVAPADTVDGNRLAHLDESDPYYVGRSFPKLTTPQWIGEPGVEAVVVLAIDDMRDTAKYEAFLRPILDRLKQIDGRAPLSIMTNQVDPADPRLQAWLAEGVSIDAHTIDHPCPLLAEGDFDRAKSTYDRCVDLLTAIPGNRPAAFRMPCCDSLNTPSPRFFAEIFNRTTPAGGFLEIDSSVFHLFTPNDPQLPRELVLEENDARQRFRKYLPFPSFVNTIEDYPYPYVIGRLCWEFPCAVPSDWEAQNLHRPNNPATVRDLEAALDATVHKQGVFNLVFHPHGWIRNDQIVELINYAVKHHGGKVKFLSFREALDRLNEHLLAGNPLRRADGGDAGVRLIDVNHDGYLDVLIGGPTSRLTRVWSADTNTWLESDFPTVLVQAGEQGIARDAGVRFGVLHADGQASMLVRNEQLAGAWSFDDGRWVAVPQLLAGLEIDGESVFTARNGRDLGVRLRDLDLDGRSEIIVGNERQQAVFSWREEEKTWRPLPFRLPEGAEFVDAAGADRGLRLVDIDEDGRLDVVFSNEQRFGLYLFSSLEEGWSRRITAGAAGDAGAIPLISRAGENNGAWFRSRGMWVQNEDTSRLPDLVDRRSFNDLLGAAELGPRSPQASLSSLHVPPGFVVELVAAEPLTMDPVAIDWGADGKLWVVEMGDYPRGADGQGQPDGRVRFLEDADGDGRYDRSTLFLDGLAYPNGVMAWRRGVLISCAPEIFYAEDTDGDGRADVKETLFVGFSPANPQHRLNGFTWGLDNWVHGATGDGGRNVKSARTGASFEIGGRDFRIRPDDDLLEPQTGKTQFGRARDDWGAWFGSDNTHPLWHFVLDDHYLRRNPHVAHPSAVRDVPEDARTPRVFPASRTLARFNDFHQANRITSACSAVLYRDELLGRSFVDNLFVCEPVHNLVHRQVVETEGVSFRSRRADGELNGEFLASSDNWFRPVDVRTGPDGALWVVDMYRHVIEHPEWIPDEWRKRLDLRAGHDRGRIYRVWPVGRPPREVPRLDALSTVALAGELDQVNGTLRDMAHRLIFERQDRAAVPQLEQLVRTSPRPASRLQALAALDGLQAVTHETLLAALDDPHPAVRRWAVRLAEPMLGESAELDRAVLAQAGDADPRVRMQAAYSLGEWNAPQAAAALATLALGDGEDPYLRTAILSSLTADNLAVVARTLLDATAEKTPPSQVLESLAGMAVVLDDRQTLDELLRAIAQPDGEGYAQWKLLALASLLDALDRENRSLDGLDAADDPRETALASLDGAFKAARGVAGDGQARLEARRAAMRLLGRGAGTEVKGDIALLAGQLAPRNATELQIAAIDALAGLNHQAALDELLRGWKGYTVELRGRVLDVLLSRAAWTPALADALESGAVAANEIDAARRQRLASLASDELRRRFERLLASPLDADRARLVGEYESVKHLPGDGVRGGEVFKQKCAACHRLGETGHPVGPDLAALTDKSTDALLVAILDPNRAVEAKYVNYLVETEQGLAVTGMLVEETGASITLAGQDGKTQVILRSDLAALESSGKSMMPEGLEKDLSRQDLADVMIFVGGLELPRKEFPGNEPALVIADAEGALRLTAQNCQIFGSTLVFEPRTGALEYWQSENDLAVWEVGVPRDGLYQVTYNYACHDEAAGDEFVLEAEGDSLTERVVGTGTWDYARQRVAGKLRLAAGRQQIVVRSAGPIGEALFDLFEIRLTPTE